MSKFTLIGSVVALVLILLVGSCSFTHVTPGNVGVQVNNLGNGVQAETKPVGWYFTPPSITIHEYPISTRTYTWAAPARDKDGNQVDATAANEEMSFQDKNGLTATADVSISYHVDQVKAAILFQKYRMDMDAVVAGPLRTAIRNALAEEASNMGVEEIYGPKKGQLITAALAKVQRQFGPQGMDIEQLYWASSIRVPPQVMAQINQKIANEQAALAAQANVAKAKAEAESKVAEAEGEAQAMKVRGEAIRTNPEILQQEAIKKWQGGVPQVISGGATTPFINIK
jgi:regulator of protease activity HflC (stomatin/prohibitin superfamily)